MPKKVSIIMSVYNSEKTIEKTIFSVLNQSFKSYEFIIINDGSKDNTKKILEKYKNRNKIKIYNFKKNMGLAARLNFAMNIAQYSYIVRIDDEDIMSENRIKFQINEFVNNKDLDVVGGSAIYFNKKYKKYIYPIESDSKIKEKIFYLNPIIHSSVMFKKRSIKKIGGYNKKFLRCQDYELWLRGRKFLKFKNLKQVLVKRNVSNFKYEFENIFYLLKARLDHSENLSQIITSMFILIKDFTIFILLKLGLKKII